MYLFAFHTRRCLSSYFFADFLGNCIEFGHGNPTCDTVWYCLHPKETVTGGFGSLPMQSSTSDW